MKKSFKPYPALAPLPVVLVTTTDKIKTNAITVAWCGIVNSAFPKLYVSIRKARLSHGMIRYAKEFVVNIPTMDIIKQVDFVGVKSGREIDKLKYLKWTEEDCEKVRCKAIAECPVAIECKLDRIIELGSHDMFIADIVNVRVDEEYVERKGRIAYERMGLFAYAHGEYYALGEYKGFYGFSVKKRDTKHKVHKRSIIKKITSKKSIDKSKKIESKTKTASLRGRKKKGV